jgi:hypothetical protein
MNTFPFYVSNYIEFSTNNGIFNSIPFAHPHGELICASILEEANCDIGFGTMFLARSTLATFAHCSTIDSTWFSMVRAITW